MLRQEDPQSITNTTSAAQTRVTPEELAHAIASLEARKQDAARVQENTIPIGEAVRELNLDATPEEVLAEVRAQRQARSQSPPPSQSSPSAAHTPPAPPPIPVPPLAQTVTDALRQAAHAAAPGLKDAARAASPALKQGMDAVSRHIQRPKPKKRKWGKEAGIAFGLFFAFVGISQSGVFGHHQHVYIPPQSRMLSTVPDGHEVSADTATVQHIADGQDPNTVSVVDGAQGGSRWILVRHDKHWYVRGYVLRDAALGDSTVKVYTDDDAGVLEGKHDESVTLRLDNSQIIDTNTGDDWSEIDMSQIHPDDYTHD